MHFPLVGMDARARRLPLESLLNSISGCIINARILGSAAAAAALTVRMCFYSEYSITSVLLN